MAEGTSSAMMKEVQWRRLRRLDRVYVRRLGRCESGSIERCVREYASLSAIRLMPFCSWEDYERSWGVVGLSRLFRSVLWEGSPSCIEVRVCASGEVVEDVEGSGGSEVPNAKAEDCHVSSGETMA